ncbi:MAG: flippase-like domain-containing protein [Solirubrobacterales bacterium]|nr:flippase-like domain-containing protein [Solirubrobacterales bacterium]
MKVSSPSATELPGEFQPRTLRRRTLQAIVALAVLAAIFLLAPGLGEVRDRLADARPGWLAVATLLEGLSFASYVVMFGPIFCTGLSWRRSWQIGGSELAMGSLVPASGAGGLALGAWVLHRGGMGAERIARRSVAFFLIKSGVNFVAVAVLGAVMAFGLVGPDLSLWLTAAPAVGATLALGAVVAVPRLGPGAALGPEASRLRRGLRAARRAVIDGTGEALQILRSGNWRVLAGSLGYWAFDNAVLWATFHAFGLSPPLTIILMGYLIGQLGGLLPIPGGIGGIDAGLIGTLILYGTPAAGTAAAVLGYRLILFWLPLIVGGIAFAALRRDMPSGGELAACEPAFAAQSA